ncbi:Zn-ribbon domain-containing OB-fold protein [Pseudonocardia lacus]|uniref:Zn-ribbon domain-containing OB-fold protein n=1 Tax=Pseudonocardia lacus TaxID=2835865 RepID=UPI001BDCC2B6|nr:OB-fold domain-containing protein [Pseudonocardia lacus]
MTTTYDKPLPDVDDPDMGPFWAATRQGRLTAQRCADCTTLRFPATPVCGTCLSEDTGWVDVSGTGTIWSYAVYHRAFHPGFRGELPYVVAIVENTDGLHYTGRVFGPRSAVAVGAPVSVRFDAVTPQVSLPSWVVAG